MRDLTLEQRIGLSTLCLRGIPLEEAIERALEAGFSAFEWTPITYGGPEAFDSVRCEDLRKRFEAFETVTVHSSGMGGADICSLDADHRSQSRARYIDLMRVAGEVGAGTVTFHPGRGESREQDTALVMVDNISFGKTLCQAAAESPVAIGYELFDHGVAEAVGFPNFGVLFDIGHASRRGPDITTDDVIRMIDDLSDQTVQYHVHGVIRTRRIICHSARIRGSTTDVSYPISRPKGSTGRSFWRLVFATKPGNGISKIVSLLNGLSSRLRRVGERGPTDRGARAG